MARIEEFLEERRKKDRLRILRPARFRREGRIYFKDKEFLDFSSNDYLGLSGHPEIKEAAQKATAEYGTSSSASRLLSGDLNLHHQLEEEIAAFKGKESALIFNSGYQANLGIISAICKRGDAVFSDRLNHASIVDGILLSGAKFFRFHHNDTNHLEHLLKRERNKFKEALLITETVFSMDGDRCPLKEMVELKQRYDCRVMVDEAHATGVFGEDGSGVVEEEGLTGEVDLIMGTFSKALGSFGAYLACGSQLKEFLINASRSFIYSTSLPPAVVAANLISLELVKKEPFRRKKLLENSDYLRCKLKEEGFEAKGCSQIIPLILKEGGRAVEMARMLQARGYWVLPIRPPTVPEGESRLRFSLTYNHSKEILERLANDICEINHL